MAGQRSDAASTTSPDHVRGALRRSATTPNLPRGTVTFLFTDMEGSTRLVQQLGAGYGVVLADYRRLLRAVWASHGGHEFGTEGDASFVAFTRAEDALRAGAAALTALADHRWRDGVQVRARIGVHTGTPTVVDDDYVGLDVHRVARICAAAHGGQVLLSQATRELAAADAFEFRNLGEHRLKDLDRAERLWQLCAPELASEFPPPRTAGTTVRLPTVGGRFVGRKRELAELETVLSRADVRLVTLTGPGGAGKTRLAVEIARRIASAHPDGVFFVPLAATSDPDQVGEAMLTALGVRETSHRDPAEAVAAQLEERRSLLVFDNFEQVLDAVGLVRRVLERAPATKAIVTSRAVLNIGIEHEYSVQPLSLPPPGSDPDALRRSEAVELFLRRAEAVQPGFRLDETTAAAVAEITARVDGLPLAIELAASHLRVLSVHDLRRRLQGQLPLLRNRSRDLEGRQRTLRDTIDWSYRLLPPADQDLFCRLSVFSSGWSLDTAESVVAARDDDDGEAVLEGVATLVEHSLVTREETADGQSRFRMLETIREYAAWRLEESGRAQEVRRRHAEFFISLAEKANERLDGPEQMAWLARFTVELDNLRAALEWSLADPGDADRHALALRLARGLGWFWFTRGLTREGLSWLERVLDAQTGPPVLRARALYWFAALLDRSGQTDRAQAQMEESARLFRELGDSTRLAHALNALGASAFRRGDHDTAAELYAEALALCEQSDEHFARYAAGIAHGQLGDVALQRGDLGRAEALYRRGLADMRAHGGRWGVALMQRNLARVAAAQGAIGRACAGWVDALAFFRDWEERAHLAEGLEALSGIAAGIDEPVPAARLLGAAASIRESAAAALLDHEQERLDRHMRPARDALGSQSYSAAVAEGRAMTRDQAIDYALAWAQAQAAGIQAPGAAAGIG